MTIPLVTSPGRGGFGPTLELAYDSGQGDGPFGIGWPLTLPSITLRTDRGRPRYAGDDADVPLLAGAEDLVPVLAVGTGGRWDLERLPPRVVGGTTYRIRRFRPRVEGTFSWIERWSDDGNRAETFWRAIGRDNVTTWFGRTAESRIADPADTTRIFSWLPCETYDDRGNVAVYRYLAEDSVNVDVTAASERNRTQLSRSANRYLKRIRYGNCLPYLPRPSATDAWPAPPGATAMDGSADWYFEAVLDYGEHDEASPTPGDADPWLARPDPFSSYRSGFEVRTYRLCRRVLMFHHFDGEPDVGRDCLVRSTSFEYSTDQPVIDLTLPRHSQLASVVSSGHVRRGAGYLTRSLPPLQFAYTSARIDDAVRVLGMADLEGVPAGVDGLRHQWVDLDGEGVSGVLSEQHGGWFYKRNLSPALVANKSAPPRARLGAPERVRTIPSRTTLAGQQLLDLAGDGQLDVAVFDGPAPGFTERGEIDGWESFRPFGSLPNLPWRDPNVRLVDLTGDGLADVLVTAEDGFTWYPSVGEDGFGAPEATIPAVDEERGPRTLATTEREAIYLSDMSGDGSGDIVRIRASEIVYWPNLGYGRFGPKVTMDRAPLFDEPDQFDPKRVRLADIDGSGTVDVVYLGRSGATAHFNESGNGWTAPRHLATFPTIDDLTSASTVDLLGNGTACLVWSSPLPRDGGAPMRYIDLMGGTKPNLLVRTTNNLGAETLVDYAPSTKFYVADRLAGESWVTRLAFPVHVVERVTVRDRWRKTAFTSTYSYHHGFFDGVEREFRGFARVEQVDVEDFDTFATANSASPFVTADKRLYQPPIKTVTWYETGAFSQRARVVARLREEQFPRSVSSGPGAKQLLGGFSERELPEPDLGSLDLSAEEWREALRACRGIALREETYELDVDALHERGEHVPVRLFSAVSRTPDVQRLQPKDRNQHAVFLVTEAETITYQYDLDLRHASLRPDPRVGHTINLRIDDVGNVRQTISIGYPRHGSHEDSNLSASQLATIRDVQAELHVGYAETRHTTDVLPGATDRDSHRLRVPYEVRTYDLTGIRPRVPKGYFTPGQLREYLLSADLQPATPPDPAAGYRGVTEIGYHEIASGTAAEKRLVEHIRTLFFRDDLQAPRPLGEHGRLGLTFEAYKLALTDSLLSAVFGSKLADVVDGTVTARGKLDDSSVSGYLSGAALSARFAPRIPAAELSGQYWLRSGTAGFATDAAQHFYLPEQYTDAFGNVTHLRFDARDLFIEQSTDPVGNTVSVERFDWRVLAPSRQKDINDNLSEVTFDALGLVVAAAVMGKGTEADDLTGFTVEVLNPDPHAIATFCTSATLDETAARGWLRRASRRFIYHFGEARGSNGAVMAWAVRPPAACAFAREIHAATPGGTTSPLQVALECSDGSGGVLMQKSQAEPDTAGGPLRWIVGGKTVVNNKGKPVKQYEPYFSASFGCEVVDEVGVTPLLFYDAAGRLIRTEFADGTLSRADFGPWSATSHDPNDTVLDPGNVWYSRNSASTATSEEQAVASAAAAHAETPSITATDSLGRDVVGVSHNRFVDRTGALRNERYLTYTKLDAEGKPLWILDPRGHRIVEYVRTPAPSGGGAAEAVPGYDLVGNLLYQRSAESGERWALADAQRKALIAWNTNERQVDDATFELEERVGFLKSDALRRPVIEWLTVKAHAAVAVERFEYGESLTGAADRNMRGRVEAHYQPSGLTQLVGCDLSGNPLEVRRQAATEYRDGFVDWATSPGTKLEPEVFARITEYDALSRITRLYGWHRPPIGRVAVFEPSYNERGALAGLRVSVGATKTATGHAPPTSPPRDAVREARYDAKGSIRFVEYGNGTRVRYDTDQTTSRLVQIRTTRPGFDPVFPSRTPLVDPRVLQNLLYAYDAVGNLIVARDEAIEPVYFRNQLVDPISRFTYDSLYRLVRATGRETDSSGGQFDANERPGLTSLFPITDQTLRNYTQEFSLDAVGNIEQIKHASGPSGSATFNLEYASDSNRLSRTWSGTNTSGATVYRYDTHGNMLNLANVSSAAFIRWDYRDLLHAVDRGGGGLVFHAYDAGKERARTIATTPTDQKRWERLFLGGFEVYRRYQGTKIVEEIETHHVFLGDQRIEFIDDVIVSSPGRPTGVFERYQYSDVVRSVCFEADGAAGLISYEQFHPYGTSALRVFASGVDVPPSRYRYAGMERDETTGLLYRGSRHYAPWLGRWIIADPSGVADGVNVYQYCHDRPTIEIDVSGTISREMAKTGDQATHAAQGLRGEWKISEHLIPGALQKWIGAFRNAPPQSIGARVIAEVTGLEMSLYTKDMYQQTVTVILEKSVAAIKTKADLGMITLVRDLARAGGLTGEDLRMIYDAQRDVIADSLKKGGSKVTMSEIEHLIAAQEVQGFRLLVEKTQREALRNAIRGIGKEAAHAPRPGGKAGLVFGLVLVGGLTIAGSASAEPEPPEDIGGVEIDLEAVELLRRNAQTDTQRQFAEMIAGYSRLLIQWTIRDHFMKEWRRAHRPESLVDWTIVLPVGLGAFLSTSNNYEANLDVIRKEMEEGLEQLEADLAKNNIRLSYEERREIRRAMWAYSD
jgi:RHS repeat-associated protein